MFATWYDFHIHSTYSDGSTDISEIVRQASKLHLKAIAITDHFWPPAGSLRGGKSII
ncbi:MAG: PHP domain-containing protein [Candidatus Thorarchaeota archaeon]|nr:MAG: PHP domain-containing protein [Candidatus Thorarchaeota archaeon]